MFGRVCFEIERRTEHKNIENRLTTRHARPEHPIRMPQASTYLDLFLIHRARAYRRTVRSAGHFLDKQSLHRYSPMMK